jgi:hypothetical protein
MRSSRKWILCVLSALSVIGAGATRAQDKLPDYTRKSLAQWIEALKNKDDPILRLEARGALGPRGPYTNAAVPALIEAFKDMDPVFAAEAGETLPTTAPS